MRRPPIRTCLALGVATVLTLTACASRIAGVAAPAPAAGALDAVSTSRTTTAASATSSTQSSTTSRTSTSEEAPRTDELPTDFPSSFDIPTDLGIPTGIPTDFGLSTELPASWPAELALPGSCSISFAIDDNSGSSVLFTCTGSVTDVTAFITAEMEGMGYTANADGGTAGLGSYVKGGSTISYALLEYDGSTTGTITITGG